MKHQTQRTKPRPAGFFVYKRDSHIGKKFSVIFVKLLTLIILEYITPE